MSDYENFNEQEMKDIISKYKIKPVPESIMKDYLSGVRSKIEIEKSKGHGFGFPSWMGAVVFTYTLALAFAFGAYWVEGRPEQGLSPVSSSDFNRYSTKATEVAASNPRPSSFDIKIESDAELAALLSVLGEDENFLDEQDLSVEMERIDNFEIQGPQTGVIR